MKHTECKDCKLREGDCGYHFRVDGDVNCDIPSLSSCDKYGNCMFFEPTPVSTEGDLISREALKEDLFIKFGNQLPNGLLEEIDNAPTVETDIEVVAKDAYDHGYTDGWKERFGEPEERPQGEWEVIRVADHRGVHYSFVCPFCNYEREYYKKNFCEECGADLRGGTDK